MKTLVGLDIGGSNTRAVAVAGGKVVAESKGGSANPAAVGMEEARSNLRRLLAALGDPALVVAACAGAAGADGPRAEEQLRAVLAELLPVAQIRVVNDAHLPLAATGMDAGVVVIAGTGSIVYGRTSDGREARAGGWGHLLGDEGSGYWFAREAVRSVLAAHDSGRRPSPMHARLLDSAGVSAPVDLLHLFHEESRPDRWARLAHVVFEHWGDDPEAQAVVERGAEELAGMVATVRGRLGAPLPVVLAGGLLLGTASLEAAVRRRVAGVVIRLDRPPVMGAVQLAGRMLDE